MRETVYTVLVPVTAFDIEIEYVSWGLSPLVVPLWQDTHLASSKAWISFGLPAWFALSHGYSVRVATGIMKFSAPMLAATVNDWELAAGRLALLRSSWQPPHTRASPGMPCIQVVWLRIDRSNSSIGCRCIGMYGGTSASQEPSG